MFWQDHIGLSLAEIKDLIGMYSSTDDETPQLLECLRVMSSRREALEQQRERSAVVDTLGHGEAVGRRHRRNLRVAAAPAREGDDALVLLGGQRGRFAGGAAGDKAVDTLL